MSKIVVVDAGIDALHHFLAGIMPGFEVIVLESAYDGIQQITDILSSKHGISSLHIVSHGAAGCLNLGTAQLDSKTIESYTRNWQLWKSSLLQDADILLYGCNVAAGNRGAVFVHKLSQHIGANIAASTDLTGSSALGGSWKLQFQTGNIKSCLAVQPWLKKSYASVLHADPTSSLPSLPLSTSGTPIARINAGGGFYTDTLGRAWSADQNFVGSSYSYGITETIAGTNDSPLYQDERSGINSSSFAYNIPVTDGIYNVNLHFAEIWWQKAGQRVFDVDIEGQSFLNDFDILTETAAKTALTKSTQLVVTDGELNISFETVIENPKVNAIEILRVGDLPAAGVLAFSEPFFTVNEDGTAVSAVTVTRTGGNSGAVGATLVLTEGTAMSPSDFSDNSTIPIYFADGEAAAQTITIPIVDDTLVETTESIKLTLGNVTGGARLGSQSRATLSILDNDSQSKILINAGGGQYVDTAGQTWLADQYFSGSSDIYVSPDQSIVNTNDPTLFVDERTAIGGSSFSYEVPVVDGTYLVNLNFAEIYWDAAGKRIFNVDIENQASFQNLDIWAEIGGDAALTKSAQVVVIDGVLDIDFFSIVDNAEITSLEIIRIGDVPAPPTPNISGTLAFSAPKFNVNEDGTATTAVTVTRTGGSSGIVSAIVTPSSNGTASAPDDYDSTPITVAFGDGDSDSKTVYIPIIDDSIQERVEGISLTLSNATGGADLGTQNTATLSIVDNDLYSGFTALNWTSEVSATEAASESLSAVVDGKFYVFGGFNTNDFVSSTSQRVSFYDPATNTWERLANMPTQLTHSPTVVDGHDIYFIGGYDGLHPNNFATTAVWRYDTLSDTWHSFTPLPVPKGAGAGVLLGREIHFFGGMNLDRTINSGDHFVLNLDDPNPTWRTAASMPNPRNHLGGAVINNKIYAVGGQLFEEGDADVQTDVHVYNPVTDQWSQVASLPKARSQMGSATFVMDDRIIVAGGEDIPNRALDDVTAYDPTTDTWTALTPLPTARRSGVAGVVGSEFIYTTGWDLAGQHSTTWTSLPLGPTVSPPAGPSSILINGGGGTYTDESGQVWSADQLVSGGNTYSTAAAIASTTRDPLFQTERTGVNFNYAIPVANGTYEVDLGFAEIYWNTVNARVFSVMGEGKSLLTNYDVWADAGGKNISVTKTFVIDVADGTLNLDFLASKDQAKVSFIEITPVSGNVAPVAVDDTGTITAGTTKHLHILDNDYDLDGSINPQMVEILSGPSNGTLEIIDTQAELDARGKSASHFGHAEYSPTTGFVGIDTFTYRVQDNQGAWSNPATMTVTVSPAPSTTKPIIKIEAESMVLNTYRIEANSFASGGQLLSLKNSGINEIGIAAYTFTGASGKYDVVLGYYDENDGTAQFSVSQDGIVLDSWLLNQDLGSADAVPQTFVRRTVASGIQITPGSVFQVMGSEELYEKARFDYIEFIPV